MKRAGLIWLALLLPAAVDTLLRVREGRELLSSQLWAAAPAGVVLALVGLAHHHRAPRAWGRVVKELRQLRLPALALLVGTGLLALPVATEILGPAASASADAVMVLASSLTVATTFGLELESPLLLEYLVRPLSRRRLMAEKWLLSGVVLAAAVAQYAALSASWLMALGSAILALGVVPLLVARARQALFAALASAGLSGALAWLPGLPEAMGLVAAALVAAVSGVVFWRSIDALASEPSAQELLGRLFALRGRRSPLRALVAKEVQLHVGVLVVTAVLLAAWVAQRVVSLGATATGVTLHFLGLVLAAWSGVAPILGEERYGTRDLDRAVLPTGAVWGAKVVVSLGLTELCGVVLPGLLASATGVRASGQEWLEWAALGALVTSVGLVASATVRDLSRAFLATLAASGALLMLFGGCLLLGLRVMPYVPEGAGVLMAEVGPEARRWLMALLLILELGAGVWVALGVAHRAWLMTGVGLKALHRPFIGLAGLSLMAGVVQAVVMFSGPPVAKPGHGASTRASTDGSAPR